MNYLKWFLVGLLVVCCAYAALWLFVLGWLLWEVFRG